MIMESNIMDATCDMYHAIHYRRNFGSTVGIPQHEHTSENGDNVILSSTLAEKSLNFPGTLRKRQPHRLLRLHPPRA